MKKSAFHTLPARIVFVVAIIFVVSLGANFQFYRHARAQKAAQQAAGAGLDVVMNRCVKIEHARILGGLNWAGVNTGVISSRRPVLTDSQRPPPVTHTERETVERVPH